MREIGREKGREGGWSKEGEEKEEVFVTHEGRG